MNHSCLRKIAASTAVICDQNGGEVEVFFLIKALYLADREMLIDYGRPITGDGYVSMKLGPVLSNTYNLTKGEGGTTFQREWDAAFSKRGNSISAKGQIDTGCLSEIEEKTLREKIVFVMDLKRRGISVAHWMHVNCPEWEDPTKEGKKSKPLPLGQVIDFAQKLGDAKQAKERANVICEALEVRASCLLSERPILIQA